uniref:Enoyl-[acyl-carrier-protein] reductase, mitochondrial n=1 Tax=Eptatretus burgeri TaxID=7764 RepID=A0A8C4R5D5_EPTBU
MLAAPINPADINMVQGSYAILPSLPAVGGNEGVAEVEEVGAKVDRLKLGDWVVPSDAGFGTWRTVAVCAETSLQRIPKKLPLAMAAMLSVNPCTALRMLRDFVPLNPGNVTITSSNDDINDAYLIFQLITLQFCYYRPELEAMVAQLKAIGADHVFTEEELRKPALNDVFKPRLALNLDSSGTYALIFRNLHIRGFWITQWKKDNAHVRDLVTLTLGGKLKIELRGAMQV